MQYLGGISSLLEHVYENYMITQTPGGLGRLGVGAGGVSGRVGRGGGKDQVGLQGDVIRTNLRPDSLLSAQ